MSLMQVKKNVFSAVVLLAGTSGFSEIALADNSTPNVVFSLPASQKCLKTIGNCVIYPKSAQLPNGNIVVAFEDSIVPTSGSAVGQVIPIYQSTDGGTNWSKISEVKPPAELSDSPEVKKYTSNWTNPYLFVLPQDVGSLKKGTLLLASVVSGEDEYYAEHKKNDPNWEPPSDGDRRDVAIALFTSADGGQQWSFVNIIAYGGWQGGSASAIGRNISSLNTHAQIDPVWEPYLMVYQNQLVAYYSDENEYTGFDQKTGTLVLDPENDTAKDPGSQVLAHKTWDGSSQEWSAPVVDVTGDSISSEGGKTVLGGGRPGMANVVPTNDDKWFLTFEYWGGGANVRYKTAQNPLNFFSDNSPSGKEISNADGTQGDLPYSGPKGLSWGGSPVTVRSSDGVLAYNAAGSGDVWINKSGRSDGVWVDTSAPLGSAYSRNLEFLNNTGNLLILQATVDSSTHSPVIRSGLLGK